VGQAEYTSGARANDFAVVKACGSPQAEARCGAKRFGDSKNSPDISWILKPAKNNDERVGRRQNFFQTEFTRPYGRDDALGMFRLVDRLEVVGRHFVDSPSGDRGKGSAASNKHIDDFNATALGLF
jgi:hypothetical protein